MSKSILIRKVGICIVVVAAMLALTVGCTPSAPPAEEATTPPTTEEVKPIVVALVTVLTGKYAPIGERTKLSCEIIAKRVNEAGGIKSMGGAPLELHVYDAGGATPEGALAATEQALNEGCDVLIGGQSTDMAMASSTATNRAKKLHLSTWAFTPKVFERGYPYLFQITILVDDNIRGGAKAAAWAIKKFDLPVNKIVAGSNTVFLEQGKVIKEALEAEGLNVASKILHWERDARDFSPVALNLKKGGDAFAFIGHMPDTGAIYKAGYELKFGGYWFQFGTANDPVTWKTAGAPVMEAFSKKQLGTTLLAPGITAPASVDFLETFSALMSTSAAYGKGAVEPWNGMLILVEALEKAGSADADKLREVMISMRFPKEKSAIPCGEDITWDDNGMIRGLQPVAFQWLRVGDEMVSHTVWPEDIASEKAVFEK